MTDSFGVPRSALTLLVIPRHNDCAPLDEDVNACAWLRSLSDDGATLLMHGYTHRMEYREWRPWRWGLAYGFARGQGEMYGTSEQETARRLELGKEVIRRAQLHSALDGFVPPAWLLGRAALAAVHAAGFCFIERFGGIVVANSLFAPRVIGLGSLSGFEALLTGKYATIQSQLTAEDTRLAIHPADMERPYSRRVMERVTARLLSTTVPQNYKQYLAARNAL